MPAGFYTCKVQSFHYLIKELVHIKLRAGDLLWWLCVRLSYPCCIETVTGLYFCCLATCDTISSRECPLKQAVYVLQSRPQSCLVPPYICYLFFPPKMYVGFRTWRVTIGRSGRKSWKGICWIPFKRNNPIFLVSVPQGKMHTYPSNCNALPVNSWQNQSGAKQKHVVHKEKHQCLSDPRPWLGLGALRWTCKTSSCFATVTLNGSRVRH